MWDINSPHDLKFTLTGHTNYVTRLIIRDGKLFSGSWDCTIQVWDLDTKKVIATMLKENTNGIF
jgi:F-box/WD-40 domain protein 7